MDAPSGHIEQFSHLAKAKAFLGREFLTWLWYTAETTPERIVLKVPGGPKQLEVNLWVDDRLVLEGTASMTHSNVMKGGDPSHSREAAASLATGKTVREMKLGVSVKGGGEFSAILSCDDLNPRGLKLPVPERADGDSEKAAPVMPLGERLRATESFLTVLDGLFLLFLEQRVDPTWESSALLAMREWIKKRQGGKDSDTLH